MVRRRDAVDAYSMATLTFVFDPYCARSAAVAPAVLELWREHRSDVRFTAAHAGAAVSRFGLGPDSERSARAFCALRAVAPQLEVPIAVALHQQRMSRRVLTELALRFGADPARVFAALDADAARAELARGRTLQLGPGPALLFEQDSIVSSLLPGMYATR
jgi:hypothetical protein